MGEGTQSEENSNIEIRNSKQIQMIEIKKTPNKSKSNSGFEDFPDFRFIGLLGCFGFRASNFGF